MINEKSFYVLIRVTVQQIFVRAHTLHYYILYNVLYVRLCYKSTTRCVCLEGNRFKRMAIYGRYMYGRYNSIYVYRKRLEDIIKIQIYNNYFRLTTRAVNISFLFESHIHHVKSTFFITSSLVACYQFSVGGGNLNEIVQNRNVIYTARILLVTIIV